MRRVVVCDTADAYIPYFQSPDGRVTESKLHIDVRTTRRQGGVVGSELWLHLTFAGNDRMGLV